MRAERRQRVAPTSEVRLEASEAQLSGKLVIEAVKIGKSYGERVIVEDFSTRVMRGDRLGIIGANGAGKTTLVNLLTGKLAPDAGKVRLGAGLAMATLEQSRASLDPASTLQDALTGGGSDFVEINGERRHIIGYMRDFLFGPEQARTPVGKLSGGERGRLMLARALALPSNVLVLDEPTNDLDLETLDLLEEMLADYPGTLIVVSHDRDFLDRVATSVLMSEGEGLWREYAGGYSDMVAQRGAGVVAREAASETPAETREKPQPREKPAGRPRLSNKEQHASDDAAQEDGRAARQEGQAASPARRPRSLHERSRQIRPRRNHARRDRGGAGPRGGGMAGAGDQARGNRGVVAGLRSGVG